MPYLITTSVDAHDDGLSVDILLRRAVATLHNAHNRTWKMVSDSDMGRASMTVKGRKLLDEALSITEDGGTIGPLPDGTVIEVTRLDWLHIEKASGHYIASADDLQPALDAYNTLLEN